jgi:hypothetical protein
MAAVCVRVLAEGSIVVSVLTASRRARVPGWRRGAGGVHRPGRGHGRVPCS